jgi:hypothetical protein
MEVLLILVANLTQQLWDVRVIKALAMVVKEIIHAVVVEDHMVVEGAEALRSLNPKLNKKL